jgi:small subunit ribosomal protein S16
MLAISLMRMGAKKRPFYRVVVKEKRSKRDGKYLENLGTYNPMTDPAEVNLKHDRIQYWIGVGAQPSETVASLIKNNPEQTEEEKAAAQQARAEKAEAEKRAKVEAKRAEAEKIEAEKREAEEAARREAEQAEAASAEEIKAEETGAESDNSETTESAESAEEKPEASE